MLHQFRRAHLGAPRSSFSRANPGPGPDFLCIGLQKAGTQWLYDQLRPHPDFWMPPVKELHYFDAPAGARRQLSDTRRERKKIRHWNPRDRRFLAVAAWIAGRAINLEEYACLFDFKGRYLSGDITPAYSTLDEPTINSITARFPDLRIVLLLRDPISRFWSGLAQEARSEKGCAIRPDDWNSVRAYAESDHARLRSYPTEIAARWKRYVADDRFGFFFFDDLVSDPARLRERILRFLGARPEAGSGRRAPSFDRKADNVRFAMPPEIRARLIKHFADEVKACASMFGGPAKTWPAKYGL